MSEHNAPPSFENFLEHDLERLAREMESKRSQSETKDFDQKELIKEAIRAFPELKHDVEQGGSPGGGAVATSPADDDPRSPLPPYAQNASAETKLEIEYLSTGKRYRKFVWQDIQVDFFTATPENWGWIFLIRTGSADFSHRMAKCLNRKGYTSAEGFVRKIQNPEKRIKTPDESDIFRLADVPWIEPKDRVQ